MKKINWFYSAILLLLLAGACSPFIRVYSEVEPGINLYKYHTFNWLDNKTVSHGNEGPEWLSQRTQDKIRSSVESRMRTYALTLCEDKPDLLLHYHVVIKNEVFFIRDWWCDEEVGGQFGRCNRIQPVNYREGTLILDFIDARTGVQVWRGAAVGVLENLSPGEADARIDEAVRLIFSKFPEKPIPGITMFTNPFAPKNT